MSDTTLPREPAATSATPRAIADRYVAALTELDPLLSTRLGIRPGEDRLPDLSPAGTQATDDLKRATLAELRAARLTVTTTTAGAPSCCASGSRPRWR